MNKSDKEAFLHKMDILYYCCLIEMYMNKYNFSIIGLVKSKDCLKKAINILEIEKTGIMTDKEVIQHER